MRSRNGQASNVKLFRPLLLIALGCAVGVLVYQRFSRQSGAGAILTTSGERSVEEVVVALAPVMRSRFENLDSLTDGRPIALLAFKEKRTVELWKQFDSGWQHVRDYPFTGFSGTLGPKLREGDRQIPEGIYQIEYLNPNSSYHLSLKINYPNAFERARAKEDDRDQPGSDIFIHGSNQTIGCIPVGNENIEEIFYLIAANAPRNTKVIIAPYDMRNGVRPIGSPMADWQGKLYQNIAEELALIDPVAGRSLPKN